MSPILSLFAVSKPAAQGVAEPLVGAKGDTSSAFSAFLGLLGPDVDPAFAQPGQPLGQGLKDADVPEVTDTAALTQMAAAQIEAQGDGSSIPPTQLLEGDKADHLVTAPTEDDIEPGNAADNLVGQIISGGEASTADASAPPKASERASDLVPAPTDPSGAAPTAETSYQVAPANGGRPDEPATELAPRAAHPEQGLRLVAAPHQTQRPGSTLMPEQAQPLGGAAGQDGGSADLNTAMDAAGRKNQYPQLEAAQSDTRPQANRTAPDSAGLDTLKPLMGANRPERIEQMLLKAGPQPVDTPDLVAQAPGTVESMAHRQDLPLPSVKVTLTPQQSPAQGIAVQIAHAAQGGVKRFEIRLDPPELGRIEVRLELTQDGRSSAHLLVERAETLDLLQRDARALERALQNAGLDTSEGGLKFSLKDQGLARHSAQQADIADAAGQSDDSSDEEDDLMPVGPRRWLNAAEGGLDIRV